MIQTGAIRLRVTPSQLQEKADEVSEQIKNTEMQFRNLAEAIQRTNGYWIGEAGDLHRRKYEEGKQTIENMLRRWKEHPKDLLTMAGNYSMTEMRVQEISVELPSDVII